MLFCKSTVQLRSGQILTHTSSCIFAQLVQNSYETVCWAGVLVT